MTFSRALWRTALAVCLVSLALAAFVRATALRSIDGSKLLINTNSHDHHSGTSYTSDDGARVLKVAYKRHDHNRAHLIKEANKHNALLQDPHLAYKEYVSRRLTGKGHEDETYLYGSVVPLGAYFVSLLIGTPPQIVNCNIDTGSSVLAVPSVLCGEMCGDNRTHRYDHNASSTSDLVLCTDPRCVRCSREEEYKDYCEYYVSYGDGSYFNGILVDDRVEIAPGLGAKVRFGTAIKLTPFPVIPIDGLLGMAYRELACQPSCTDPIFDALLDSKQIKHDIFSVCMETATGGALTMGGMDMTVRKHNLRVDWVPMIKNDPKNFYAVQLTGELKVGEKTFMFPKDLNLSIVDSGTTTLLVTQLVFDTIRETVFSQKGLCKRVRGLCDPNNPFSSESIGKSWFNPFHCAFGLTIDEVRLLPDLEFVMVAGPNKEYRLKVPATTYMIGTDFYNMNGVNIVPRDKGKPDESGNVGYCLGMFAMPEVQWGTNIGVIFGNTIMSDKYITIYDRENNRMGFADMVGHKCHYDANENSQGLDYHPPGEEPKASEGHGGRIKFLIAIAVILACGGAALLAWRVFYHSPSGYSQII